MQNKLLNITTGILIPAGFLALFVLIGITSPTKHVGAAALDCTETINVQVHIYDDGHPNVNNGLLNLGGAYVDFSDNIQTGGFAAIRYYDNQSSGTVRDDNDRRGIIEERTACRDIDTIVEVTVTLGFRENLDCTVIGDATQPVDLSEDVVVEMYVDDCEAVSPTATPTATAVPATATATLAPATATPQATVQVLQPKVFVSCPDGSIHEAPFTCPVPTAPAVPVATVTPGRITAPNTGSGGLLTIPCGWEFVPVYVDSYWKYVRNGWGGTWVYVPGHWTQVWTYVC